MTPVFDGQHILITGGTGSLGKTLVARILSGKHGDPERITVLSRDEAKQDAMRRQFAEHCGKTLFFRLGDVRCYSDVLEAMVPTSIVINAAALKQVPSCEYAPEQAILTNCMGPLNIVHASRFCERLHTVVGISTDKACEPVNTMGMTKALQERIFIAANLDRTDVRFLCVRYGNVLASRGSVIPLFKEQIEAGGPVTITSTQMTRFLLTLEQAVDTILTAIIGGWAGDIWVPRVRPAKIIDVAAALIGDKPIEIRDVGIRPGEKIHECLISDSERHRSHEMGQKYFVVMPPIPELRGSRKTGLDRPYLSCDDVMLASETRSLLAQHGLLEPGKVSGSMPPGELLV